MIQLSYFISTLRERIFQTGKCRTNTAKIWNQNSGGNHKCILKSAYLSKVKSLGSDELPQASENVHILIERSILVISAFIEINVGHLELDKCPNFLRKTASRNNR